MFDFLKKKKEEKYQFLPMQATTEEINCFLHHTLESKNYLEFGCGGSTFLMLYTTKANIFSVESNPDFIRHLQQNFLIQQGRQEKRLEFFLIDIGKTKAWGYPIDDSKKQNYPLYSSLVFNTLPQSTIQALDTIFIDGRFRVACALNAILYSNQDCKIIIHDFFNREHYHILLDFLEIFDGNEKSSKKDTLGIFQKKPLSQTDKEHIKNLLKVYSYDPR